jgi:hypothetical protein
MMPALVGAPNSYSFYEKTLNETKTKATKPIYNIESLLPHEGAAEYFLYMAISTSQADVRLSQECTP